MNFVLWELKKKIIVLWIKGVKTWHVLTNTYIIICAQNTYKNLWIGLLLVTLITKDLEHSKIWFRNLEKTKFDF